MGGVGQNKRQKKLTANLFKKLALYRQADEFSHFGSELAIDSKYDLQLGKLIYEAVKQPPEIIYTTNEQDLILGTVMKTEGKIAINIDSLKRKAKQMAVGMEPNSDDWEPTIAKLLAEVTIQAPTAIKPSEPQPKPQAPGAEPAAVAVAESVSAADKADKKEKK